MLVFKNIKSVDVHMNRPNGPGFLVRPDATFEGSDYYLKYTAQGGATGDNLLLEVVSGTPQAYAIPYNTDTYEGVNKFKSYTAALSGDFADNTLDFVVDLGKEATYLRISGAATLRINNDPGSDVAFTGAYEFPTNKISISMLALSGSGSVTVLAGTSLK